MTIVIKIVLITAVARAGLGRHAKIDFFVLMTRRTRAAEITDSKNI